MVRKAEVDRVARNCIQVATLHNIVTQVEEKCSKTTPKLRSCCINIPDFFFFLEIPAYFCCEFKVCEQKLQLQSWVLVGLLPWS